MKTISLIVFLCTLFHTVIAQHENIIHGIPTDEVFKIEKGDRIEFQVVRFDHPIEFNIPGKADNYLIDKKRNKDAILFTNQKTHEVVSFDIFTTFGDFTREIFSGPSGFYKIQFNLKNEQPKIFVSGKIFILNKEGHKNRNFYNRVAKGKLVRCNGDTFMDENGCKWELVSYMGSLYHDPSNNVKFLHKTSGVGEYETIRTLIGKETRNSDVFEGPNLITGIYAGSYNFGKTYGVDYKSLSHQFLDMAPHNDEWGKIYKDFGEVFLSACKTSLNSISTLFLIPRTLAMSLYGDLDISVIDELQIGRAHV